MRKKVKIGIITLSLLLILGGLFFGFTQRVQKESIITYEVDVEKCTITFSAETPYKITNYEFELDPILQEISNSNGSYCFEFTDTGFCFLDLYYEDMSQLRTHSRFDLTLSESNILTIIVDDHPSDVYVLNFN